MVQQLIDISGLFIVHSSIVRFNKVRKKKWILYNSMENMENSMENLEKKATDSSEPEDHFIENPPENADPDLKDKDKRINIHSWNYRDNSFSYVESTLNYLFDDENILDFISEHPRLFRSGNGNCFFIYLDNETQMVKIDYYPNGYPSNRHADSWENYSKIYSESYLNFHCRSKISIRGGSHNYRHGHISKCIWGESRNSNESEDSGDQDLDGEERTNDLDQDLAEGERTNDLDQDLAEGERINDLDQDLDEGERINDLDQDLDEGEKPSVFEKYKHLWVLCENCYGLNYKKFFKSKLNICEECGYHLKMSSSDRIELSIDPGTWDPMDEDMVSLDPIDWDWQEEVYPREEPSQDRMDQFDFEEEPHKDEFDSQEKPSEDEFNFEEEPYKDRIDQFDFEEEPFYCYYQGEFDPEEEPYKDRINYYQRETGLTEAVQTGTGQLKGIPVAIAVMDFQFIGGSMGSVVGEKITRLIEHATKKFLPLIIVCASGGARMQEGSLSLIQMAKIAAALHDYQENKKLFYVSILSSPTTGGVTASFGMLGDIIIAEPNAYIAFAGKRVIEQTLNKTVPEGTQETEYLFEKGSFDLIVPRNLLKSVLSELLELHAFFPLDQT